MTAPTAVIGGKDGTLLVSAAGSTLEDGRVLRMKPDGSVVRPITREHGAGEPREGLVVPGRVGH